MAVAIALVVLVGLALATEAARLTWPWAGAGGGESSGESIRLEAVVGQPAAGLSGGPAHRLCIGAACPEGPIAEPPAPRPRSWMYVPIARRGS